MIECKNLCFSYGEKEIIKNFSANFEVGERVCIKGESGKGKTTLLRLLCSLEKPTSGSVKLKNSPKIGFVFQEDRLLPWATAKENVSLVSNEEAAERWLSAFGLTDSLKKYPSELSGGMCRRVALARAVAFEPNILILDEAFKGLDDKLKESTMKILAEHFSNALIIFTSHDSKEIDFFSTRIIEI